MPTDTFFSLPSDGACHSSTTTTYAAARDGTGSGGVSAVGGYISVGQDFFSGTYFVYEGFLNFDTSSIPDNAVISSVVLSLYVDLEYSATDFIVQARVRNWGDTLESSDFVPGSGLASVLPLVASASTAGWTASTYRSLAESGTAFQTSINKTGLTRLMLCSDRTVAGITPPGDEFIRFTAGESVTAPTLAVAYTIPSPNDSCGRPSGYSGANGNVYGAPCTDSCGRDWTNASYGTACPPVNDSCGRPTGYSGANGNVYGAPCTDSCGRDWTNASYGTACPPVNDSCGRPTGYSGANGNVYGAPCTDSCGRAWNSTGTNGNIYGAPCTDACGRSWMDAAYGTACPPPGGGGGGAGATCTGAKTDYAERKHLEHELGINAWAMPTGSFLALFTADPTEAGLPTDEVTGGGYVRRAIPWGLPGSGSQGSGAYVLANISSITFPISTGAWSAGVLVTFAAIMDALTGGNMLRFGPLASPFSINASGTTKIFAAGEIVASEG